jgi:anti-sigma factor ChrR (cupin superfamily)
MKLSGCRHHPHKFWSAVYDECQLSSAHRPSRARDDGGCCRLRSRRDDFQSVGRDLRSRFTDAPPEPEKREKRQSQAMKD